MKYKKILILLALAFIMGFIFSFLVYQGYWYRFVDGLKTVPWYMYFLMIFITFFVTLIIHELTHLCTFVFQGIKIRALYIHMLIIYRSTKRWHIKLKPKHIALIGGFVVPNLPAIEDEDTYQIVIHKFRMALITAPYATIFFLGLTIALFLISIAFNFSTPFIGFWSVFSLWTVIFSWLYIKSFKVSNKSYYGDFIAYEKMKNEPIFQLIQMVQYTGFSLAATEQTHSFLHQKMTDMLVENPLKQRLFEQLLMLNYMDGVMTNGFKDHTIVHDKILKYPIHQTFHSEQGVIIFYEIASYLYVTGNVEESYQRYQMIKQKAIKNVDKEILEYLEKKFEHQCHVCYHEHYLREHEDQAFRMQRLFEDLIDKKEMIEVLHKPFLFQEWFTHVDLYKHIIDDPQ